MSPVPCWRAEVWSVPRRGRAPVGTQGCRRLQVCVRRRRGGAGWCAAAGCAAPTVFAHVRPGCGGCTEVTCAWGGLLRLCRWREACGVPGVAPVWSQGARESRHHPCMSWMHVGCIPGAAGVGVHGIAGVQGMGGRAALAWGSLLPAGSWGLDLCPLPPHQDGGSLAGLCLPISELRLWCYPLHLWVYCREGN